MDHFEPEPPADDALTAYDRQHLVTYLRLLDAAAEGADWEEVVEVIFAIGPKADPAYARRLYDSHLARARWMTTSGYRDLLNNPKT